MSNIPYRECACGNQIMVGGTSQCDACSGFNRSKARVCGSCFFWARGYNGTEGIGGHHTDGSVSECRARSPIGLQPDMELHGDRKFPTTKFDDFCGEWRQGAVSSRLTR